MQTIELVKQFHRAFGHPVSDQPHISSEELNALRLDLLEEELTELRSALFCQDEAEVLDALTDLQVVLDGAYLAWGFHRVKEAAFAEVHKSNMAKLGPDGKPIYRADNKILKPEGWKAPNLWPIVNTLYEPNRPTQGQHTPAGH